MATGSNTESSPCHRNCSWLQVTRDSHALSHTKCSWLQVTRHSHVRRYRKCNWLQVTRHSNVRRYRKCRCRKVSLNLLPKYKPIAYMIFLVTFEMIRQKCSPSSQKYNPFTYFRSFICTLIKRKSTISCKDN